MKRYVYVIIDYDGNVIACYSARVKAETAMEKIFTEVKFYRIEQWIIF